MQGRGSATRFMAIRGCVSNGAQRLSASPEIRAYGQDEFVRELGEALELIHQQTYCEACGPHDFAGSALAQRRCMASILPGGGAGRRLPHWGLSTGAVQRIVTDYAPRCRICLMHKRTWFLKHNRIHPNHANNDL